MADAVDAVRAIEKRNGLRPGQHRHSWFITQNNPAEQIPECAGKSPEEIVQWAVAHCVRNMKGGLLKSRGVGVCYERGAEEHTDHIHIVLSFTGRNGGKAETVYRLWPKADIEVANGTVEDLEDYLYKRGRFEGKGETVVAPAFDGEPLMANNRDDGKQSDPAELSKRDMRWQMLSNAIKDGVTEEEIWNDETLSLYAKDFVIPMDRLLAAHAAKRPHKRTVNVVWIMGEQSSSDQSVPLEAMESAVRDWLDGTGARWGEWDFSLVAQPHVSAYTDVVLLVIPGWGLSSDAQMAYRIMSGSPFRVAQGYGRGFWAAWHTVVVVCGQNPRADMAPLVTHGAVIPLGASAKRMREIVSTSTDDTALIGLDELCAMFEVTDVKQVKRDDVI